MDIKNQLGMEFGILKSGAVVLSAKGLAVHTGESKYVAFDGEELHDVTGMTFKMNDVVMCRPTKLDSLEAGALIKDGASFLWFLGVEDGTPNFINPRGVKLEKAPIQNMFGINYYTEITSPMADILDDVDPMLMLSMGGENAGGMNPLVMSALLKEGSDIDPMVMMAMNGNNTGEAMNPMVMAALLKGRKKQPLPANEPALGLDDQVINDYKMGASRRFLNKKYGCDLVSQIIDWEAVAAAKQAKKDK